MAADPTGRPPSKFPCIYWDGLGCTATSKFEEDDISCYNGGNCDGFGTCRGCSKYDQGGLKLDSSDGNNGQTQTPFNLQVYNIRAKIGKCCHWNGAPEEFSKQFVKTDESITILGITDSEDNVSLLVAENEASDFDSLPDSGKFSASKEGTDENGRPYPVVNITYSRKNEETRELEGVFLSPKYFSEGPNQGRLVLDTDYTLYIAAHKAAPVFKVLGSNIDSAKKEMLTKCTVAEAAPWQEGFTEENPSAYGCNGAKPECTFYTGPRFTEVIDLKMDTGDRVTAKQIMELRHYSQDWRSVSSDAFKSPRELWEDLFHTPDIWAMARDTTDVGDGVTRTPGKGRFDSTTGKPMIQKVFIDDFTSETPSITVGPPILPEDGTPVTGGTPTFPTLVSAIFDLTPGPRVLFPRGTSASNPFVKRSFTEAERFLYISFDAQTDNEVVAINLTKYPQGDASNDDFIKRVRQLDPSDINTPFISGLPGQTVSVELEYSNSNRTLNHIRIFVDTGVGEEEELDGDLAPGSFDPEDTFPSLPNGKRKYVTADVYVEHVFHHAHVAQTYFNDYYGHKTVDPWINNFTRMDLGGKVFDLTGNTAVSEVLWNTIASDGKKTMYSIETQVSTTSEDTEEIRWESLGCSYILVEFLNPKVNRVAPWKAWGLDSKEQNLFVKLDRSQNDSLTEDEPTEIEYELSLASTQGTALPANIAIFKPKETSGIRPPDETKDIVSVRYAYTEYKQGPLSSEDIQKLKFAADSSKIIELMPYQVSLTGENFAIDGTFVKVGDTKLYSCEEVLGDCFTEKAKKNEELARSVFFGGGINEGQVKTHFQMINECAAEFNTNNSGKTFEDGTPVTYDSAVTKLQNLYLREGSQHYLFIFKDEEGRPIGVKNAGFLTQSAVAQARDVEIRYKWGGQAQHYPNHHQMFMFADDYAPMYATTDRLVHLIQSYDPNCGDHAVTEGGTQYRAFDLGTDHHGALWYPYKRCFTPTYHADRNNPFTMVVEYTDTVEGFSDDKRRDYWERMRVWDKYIPAVVDYIPQPGCFWSERTTTVYVTAPFVFLGYTKIRSLHPFGYYNTDRESLRVSRHWEKRNLEFTAEVLAQDEDGGFSLELDPEYAGSLYDEDGNLNEGEDLKTPVWVHINDSIGIVSVASESLIHPFNNLLLSRVGIHEFNETFNAEMLELRQVMEERDYTSSLDRNEDGTLIYLADGTEVSLVNTNLTRRALDEGKDIRLAYKKETPVGSVGWCWLAEPDQPIRADFMITGLYLSNPQMLFKKNLVPSTCTTHGFHTIQYLAHAFNEDGEIETPASLSMDGGPPVLIDVSTGSMYIEEGSPYSPESHVGEDYNFVLYGAGPNGLGIIADSRGIQRFEVDGVKFATYAGLSANIAFDIDELPYEVHDVRTLPNVSHITSLLNEIEAEYSPDLAGTDPNYTRMLTTGMQLLKGHYFVENIEVKFTYGGDYDIPTITALGMVYSEDSTTTTSLFSPTDYIDGSQFAAGSTYTVSLAVNARLAGINLSFGARLASKRLFINSIKVNVRKPVNRSETVFVSTPKVNVSTAQTGSHHPAELEFFFQRSNPDFAKNYVGGTLSLGGLGQDITPLAGVEVKFSGRRVKDLLPHFEFSDPINNRFPYNNIDITEIPGYIQETTSLGTIKYIDSAVQTSSKGWTMYTLPHEDDPADSLAHPNTLNLVRPYEEKQAELYNNAASLLGDKVAVYQSFWHPKEKAFFARSGINLDEYSWTLTLRSTVASIDKVFRHENYGCSPEATNEYTDGLVHKIENWQARGVFHYQCDPRFNYACYRVLMNKCETYLFTEYGTEAYLDNDVLGRFNYKFTFPPKDAASYVAAGLIDRNYTAGTFGGFNPTSPAAAVFSQIPNQFTIQEQTLAVVLPTKGPGKFQ